jgi:chromosome segregation ATPase
VADHDNEGQGRETRYQVVRYSKQTKEGVAMVVEILVGVVVILVVAIAGQCGYTAMKIKELKDIKEQWLERSDHNWIEKENFRSQCESISREKNELNHVIQVNEKHIGDLKFQLTTFVSQNQALRTAIWEGDEEIEKLTIECKTLEGQLAELSNQRDQFKRDAETARIVVCQKIEQLAKAAGENADLKFQLEEKIAYIENQNESLAKQSADKFNLTTELDRFKIALTENANAKRKKSWKQFINELMPT